MLGRSSRRWWLVSWGALERVLPLTATSRTVFRRAKRRPARSIGVERLEPRTMLTTYLVDTLDGGFTPGDGRISLAEALLAASEDRTVNEAPAGTTRDLIRIDPALAGGVLPLSGLIPIEATGGGLLIIDGGGTTIADNGLVLNREGVTVLRNFVFENVDGAAIRELGSGPTLLADLTITGLTGPLTPGQTSAGIISENGLLRVRETTITGTSNLNGGGLELTDTTALLQSVTVTGGVATAPNGVGGAVAATDSRVLIERSQFGGPNVGEGNTAPQAGGAVSLVNSQAVVRGTTFRRNSAGLQLAETGRGGAIAVDADSALVLRSTPQGLVRLQGNFADEGGAIFNAGRLAAFGLVATDNVGEAFGGAISNTGAARVAGSTIQNNVARFGGGISSFLQSTLVVTSSSLIGNSASFGAGLYVAENTSAALLGSQLVSNVASSVGGGAVVRDAARLRVVGSRVYDNAATEGNGVATPSALGGGFWSEGRLAVLDSQIEQNRADDLGGGLYNNGRLVLRDSTVARNMAGTDGGGLFTDTAGQSATPGTTFAGNVPNDMA